MNKPFGNFWEELDATAFEVRAKERVVALRSDVSGPSLSDEKRQIAVVESVVRSVAVADMMADKLPADEVTLSRIDAAARKLAHLNSSLKARAAMKDSLAELAGKFGRSP